VLLLQISTSKNHKIVGNSSTLLIFS